MKNVSGLVFTNYIQYWLSCDRYGKTILRNRLYGLLESIRVIFQDMYENIDTIINNTDTIMMFFHYHQSVVSKVWTLQKGSLVSQTQVVQFCF